jgi:hypothetical protein
MSRPFRANSNIANPTDPTDLLDPTDPTDRSEKPIGQITNPRVISSVRATTPIKIFVSFRVFSLLKNGLWALARAKPVRVVRG